MLVCYIKLISVFVHLKKIKYFKQDLKLSIFDSGILYFFVIKCLLFFTFWRLDSIFFDQEFCQKYNLSNTKQQMILFFVFVKKYNHLKKKCCENTIDSRGDQQSKQEWIQSRDFFEKTGEGCGSGVPIYFLIKRTS